MLVLVVVGAAPRPVHLALALHQIVVPKGIKIRHKKGHPFG